MKLPMLAAWCTLKLRAKRLSRFFTGPGDPQLSTFERRELAPLEQLDSELFDEFQKDLIAATNHEETERASLSHSQRTHELVSRMFDINIRPWSRAATELDVAIPALVDEHGEPDEQAFSRLKRLVRLAQTQQHRESWKFFALVAGVLLSVFGVTLNGCAMYVQHVYQRDFVTVTITKAGFHQDNADIEGFLVNSGTRPVAIRSIAPMIQFRAGVAGSRLPLLTSTPLPLIVEPGRVQHFRVAVPFDAESVYADDDQYGTRRGPDEKALSMIGHFEAWDASGGGWTVSFPLSTQLFGPEGMRNGGNGFEVAPRILVSRRRWLGAVGY